jgi:hypothetical protein
LRVAAPAAGAARHLRSVPPDRIADVVPALVTATADADPQVRLSAVETLGSFQTLAIGSAATLRKLSADADSRIVKAAATALDLIDPQPDPAARQKLLDNRTADSPVRSRVIPEIRAR